MDLEIKDYKLDFSNYLPSFLEKAIRLNLINQDSLQFIYSQITSLLIKKCTKFTLEESSSLPEETVNSILNSINYTIGIELQSFYDFSHSVNYLLNTPIEDIYLNGLKKINQMIKKSKLYHLQIKKQLLTLNVEAYKDTLTTGLDIFFKRYDPEFSSHDTPASIDYPLAYEGLNTVGIQYIFNYVKSIYVEGLLCRYVGQPKLLTLLRNYDKNYPHLLFNIFKLIVTNTIGCIVINKDIGSLLLTENECKYINQIVNSYTDIEYSTLKKNTLNILLINSLKNDDFSKDYISHVIDSVLQDLKSSLNKQNIYFFFVTTQKYISAEKSDFIDGISLDDDTFRSLFNEIRSLRFPLDKIEILKANIKSIKDLIDFLNGDIFLEHEYNSYFSTLSNIEISVLISKSILYSLPPEKDFITQLKNLNTNIKWQIQLITYVSSLSKKDTLEISDTLQSLDTI